MKHFYRNNLSCGIVAALIMLACIYLFNPAVSVQVNRGLSMLTLHDVKGLTMQLGGLGSQAALLSMVLNILQILYAPLPFTTVLTATVSTVGSWTGLFICWLGILLGAATAYSIARVFLQIIVNKKSAFLQVEKSFPSYGVLWVIAAWLIPVWPAELVAYLAGISYLDFKSFIGATAIAVIPKLWLAFLWGEIIPGPFTYALWVGFYRIITICFFSKFMQSLWWIDFYNSPSGER